MKKISIVIPMYNEHEIANMCYKRINEVIKQLNNYEYERQERKAGKTKYPLKKMLKLASDGIVSFSTKPLKIVGGLGIITIIISIIILIYSLISYACNLNQLTPRVDFNNGCNNTI